MANNRGGLDLIYQFRKPRLLPADKILMVNAFS